MSGFTTPDPREGPGGLIVMVRNDPDLAARALARELHADLAVGGTATEQALDRLASRPADADELDRLTAALRRAEEVRIRTRERQAASLTRTLNTQMAIHPDTIRRAADELIAAETEVKRAKAGKSPTGSPRSTATRSLIAVVLAGAGIGLAALGAPEAGLATLIAVTVGWAAGLVTDRRAIRAALPDLEALEALARRRWEQVAGRGADPTDVHAVIHRYDPQEDAVADLVAMSPAVRAADRAAQAYRTAWVRAWREVIGERAEPQSPELRELLAREHTELWLGTSDAVPLDATTLVVSSPYEGLTEERAQELHRRLLQLPSLHRVIVVLAPTTRLDASVIDLTDETEAKRLLDLDAPHRDPVGGTEQSVS